MSLRGRSADIVFISVISASSYFIQFCLYLIIAIAYFIHYSNSDVSPCPQIDPTIIKGRIVEESLWFYCLILSSYPRRALRSVYAAVGAIESIGLH